MNIIALFLALIPWLCICGGFAFGRNVPEIKLKDCAPDIRGTMQISLHVDYLETDKLQFGNEPSVIPTCFVQNVTSLCSVSSHRHLLKDYSGKTVIVFLKRDKKCLIETLLRAVGTSLGPIKAKVYVAFQDEAIRYEDLDDSDSKDLLKKYQTYLGSDAKFIVLTSKDNPFRYGDLSKSCVSNESYTLKDKCTVKVEADGTLDSSLRHFSKTSVLFVSVSFIILMVISLAWLVFYYVQRFRYAHAKDRLARRLFNAAKKALTKIPTKPLRQGDKELETDCPVCIDPYTCGDIVRVLPCKHVFHKTCVDPWLLEHRTCPMCKMDILKAFGYNFGHYDEARRAEDGDRGSVGGHSSDGHVSSNEGSYSAYPFPLVTDSDIQDPFFPSPAGSPSMVQQVLHQGNVRGFSIIPLTVHSNTVIRPASTANLTQQRGSDDSSITGDVLVKEESHHSAEIHRPPDPLNTSTSSGGAAGSCESSSSSEEESDGGKKRLSLQFGEIRPQTAPTLNRIQLGAAQHRSKSMTQSGNSSKRSSTASAPSFQSKSSRRRVVRNQRKYKTNNDFGSLESL